MILRLNRTLPLWMATGALLLSSCGEPDAIGIEVQPAGDNINVFFTDISFAVKVGKSNH